jgi:hypothetical protein
MCLGWFILGLMPAIIVIWAERNDDDDNDLLQ